MINTKVRIGITGGEGGIRTLEANLHSPNRLAGGPFRPLKHLSELCGKQYNNTDIIKKYIYGWFVFARIKRSCTFDGAPEGIRTPNLRIRSPLLYPIELQALIIALKLIIVTGRLHLLNTSIK